MTYFLTVEKAGEELFSRKPFNDYSEALEACSSFCIPRSPRAVLTFVTETVNGNFARSYAEINRPEDIDPNDEIQRARYAAAARLSNAFDYTDSYFFLVESDFGIEDINLIKALDSDE